MSGEINVISRTQVVLVEPSSSSISIINAGPPGPGAPFTSMFQYAYSQNATAPPNTGQARSNGTTAANSTIIWLHRLDSNSIDERLFLLLMKDGDKLLVQDKQNSTSFAIYRLTSDPVDNTNYVTMNVAIIQEGTTALAGTAIILGPIRT